MFVILAYDINVKRIAKVMKICRKYLCHVQKSVFEGNITEAKLEHLKTELKRAIDTDRDTICIYCMESVKFARKYQIGVSEENNNVI